MNLNERGKVLYRMMVKILNKNKPHNHNKYKKSEKIKCQIIHFLFGQTKIAIYQQEKENR